MSFFFQTVAGILRGSANDSSDRCCRNHFCHHQGDQGGTDGVDRLIERSPRRISLKTPTPATPTAYHQTLADVIDNNRTTGQDNFDQNTQGPNYEVGAPSRTARIMSE